MNKKYLKAILRKDGDKLEFVATDETLDRQGESVPIDSWDLTNFKKAPRLLVDHCYMVANIVGVAKNLRQEGKQLIFEPVFHEITEIARGVKEMVNQGFLNTVSVGFMPKEVEGKAKNELLEISFVAIPANPNATQLAVKELQPKQEKEVEKFLESFDIIEKGVVASHEPPKADEEMDWDADAAVARLARWASSDGSGEKEKIDWAKFRTGFTWFDSEEIENLGSYKLPHHDIVDERFNTIWRGVAAGMAVLLGARGGVDVPDDDKKGIYNHLANHYKQFDQEPPEFALRSFDAVEALKQEEGTIVQTLILSKEVFETEADARKWVLDHDFKADKVDETENSWRFRQEDPGVCQEDTQRTIELTEGVSAVICRPKEGEESVCALGQKSGRELSKKNRKMLEAAISNLKTIASALEKLLKEADRDEGDPAGGKRDQRSEDEKGVELPKEIYDYLKEIQSHTRQSDKHNEIANSLIKEFLHSARK